MKKPVTTAVIAAAGYGSRFLPQTKAIPKEMLPLVDKPVIQYIVEELVEAGITDIIIVTADGKPSIKEHFGAVSGGLKQNLLASNKTALLDKAESIATLANFTFVKQTGPYGNATPLMSAAHLLAGKPFIYTYADDFFVATPNRFSQMIHAYHTYGGSVMSCVKREAEADYRRYGYVSGQFIGDGIMAAKTIVEKPGSRQASPSNLASVSSYLMEEDILEYLQRQLSEYDGSKEFQIQDAMQQMMSDGFGFFGCEIKGGQWYDTGNPLEYIKTVYNFALAHADIGADFQAYVAEQQQVRTRRKSRQSIPNRASGWLSQRSSASYKLRQRLLRV